jgi:hypothetical protein
VYESDEGAVRCAVRTEKREAGEAARVSSICCDQDKPTQGCGAISCDFGLVSGRRQAGRLEDAYGYELLRPGAARVGSFCSSLISFSTAPARLELCVFAAANQGTR